ncbi:hypothetical protein FocTR4_00003935 [Fusarium oxysporum f. sp. cubense]|uniref:Uncharacterized protein n=1 Tax=Fusarium oxysporum f. sp. cubense TaxID=61366 RepID=A0A5C6TAH4_FUSOC|nr:hypothetical protein FocTR4_00003935 [Fusarium oxysporum f. sp. cubense]
MEGHRMPLRVPSSQDQTGIAGSPHLYRWACGAVCKRYAALRVETRRGTCVLVARSTELSVPGMVRHPMLRVSPDHPSSIQGPSGDVTTKLARSLINPTTP